MLDPEIYQPVSSIQIPNRIGNSIQGYGRWDERRSSVFWDSKRVDGDDDDGDSGFCSPPLWKTSPTRSPRSDKSYYQILSPSSRTELIARGQRELMEMVRNMPESDFELTLKDLVENTKVKADEEENEKEEKTLINKNEYRREGSGSSSGRMGDQRAAIAKNGNFQSGGFYLKMMMFPPSLGSRKKKKKKEKKGEKSGNEGSNVNLRTSVSEGSLKDIVHKEWWKKSPSASLDSENGTISDNCGSIKSSGSSSSGSSGRSRRERRRAGSCWFLIGRPKRQTQEE